MTKRLRKTVILALTAVFVLAMSFFCYNFNRKAFAFTGVSQISEYQLYNETNTYNVASSNFTSSGSYIPVTDNNRITSRDQFRLTYDMSVKQSRNVADYAQVTVLTPGLCSQAFVWSNTLGNSARASYRFAYDEASLISKIVAGTDNQTNVYWARMTGYNSFDLFDITNQRGVYNTNNPVSAVTDTTKHVLLVFDPYMPNNSNDNVYYQLNYMLSRVLYDLKTLKNGVLPKVNLIGHSRGGITNLQYALDHPDMVASLISIGTPYFGTTTGLLFGTWVMDECDGLTDVLSAETYYGYNNRWNSDYERLYSNIKVQSIGGYHTLKGLKEIVSNDLYMGLNDMAKGAICGAIDAVAVGKTLLNSTTASLLTKVLGYFYPENRTVACANVIVEEINFDWPPHFMSWYNDGLVPLDSQLGKNAGSPGYGGGNYAGFNYFTRVFSDGDSRVQLNKVAVPQMGIGHNLETRDPVIIDKIIGVLCLDMGYDSGYVTKENDDGTLTFVTFTGTYPGDYFFLPATIDGKTVTKIGSFAFDGEDDLEAVVLPYTITEIDNYAFAGLTNLEEISFDGDSQLESIGYAAFAGCSLLNKFNASYGYRLIMPEDVVTIGAYAFAGTKFGYVEMRGQVESIGDGVFAGCPILEYIDVGNGCLNYFTEDGVLFNADGWLMQYPQTKTDTTYTVPSSKYGIEIKFISPYAFYGNTELTELDLNGVKTMGDYALAGCENLSVITGSAVEYVAPTALLGVPATQNGQFYTLGEVLVRYNGNATALDETDFPSGIKRIASFAFYDKDNLVSVNLPSNIRYLDERAFVDCENFSKVRFTGVELPTIFAVPFAANAEGLTLYCRKSIKDALTNSDLWKNSVPNIAAIKTDAYFSDADVHANFYLGQIIQIPSCSVPGYYVRGWKRVNANGEAYGNYLAPSEWTELVDTVTYKATLVPIGRTTLTFKNGNHVVGALIIQTGDELQLRADGYTLNGNSVEFTNAACMHECNYGSYSGEAVVQNQAIATFAGWKANGVYVNDGVWSGDYPEAGVELHADWQPVNFTITLTDAKNNTTDTLTYNYFNPVSVPVPAFSGYQFMGWYDENGQEVDTEAVLVGNYNLHAVYDELYTVILSSTTHASSREVITGVAGAKIILPTKTSGNYEVIKWGIYDVNTEYTITGNCTLQAVWKGKTYSITYANLVFDGFTSGVYYDNNWGNAAPASYEYGIGVDLTRVGAAYSSSGPYVPQLIFIGWCTDANLNNSTTAISTSASGNITLYAKWRYDYSYLTTNRTITINNGNPLNQEYDQIGLVSMSMRNSLKAIKINKFALDIYIRLKEVNYDGWQYIFLYGGADGNTKIGEYAIKTDVTTEYSLHRVRFIIDLDVLNNTEHINIRYQANTAWFISRDWMSNLLHCQLSYVKDEADLNNPEFWWQNACPSKTETCYYEPTQFITA